MLDDFLGQDFWGWEVFGVFQGFVFEPEDIKVGFVTGNEFVVGEGFPAVNLFRFAAFAAVFGLEYLDEFLKIVKFEAAYNLAPIMRMRIIVMWRKKSLIGPIINIANPRFIDDLNVISFNSVIFCIL